MHWKMLSQVPLRLSRKQWSLKLPRRQIRPNLYLTLVNQKFEKLKAETAELKSQEEQLRLRNEEDELRRELLERRKQVANWRGKIPQPSVVSKNRTTVQTESSFSKINEDLDMTN